MTIAGFEISKCPNCSKLYKTQIIGSFNTCDAEFYSDGFVKGEWIPVIPSILKCVNNKCKKIFNIQESEVIAKINRGEFNDPQWNEAYPLSGYEIGIDVLEEALFSDLCHNKDSEYTVRILLLRRYNDVFRKERTIPLSDRKKSLFIYNIEKIIELYKRDEANIGRKIFLAELYREKGDFNACLVILNEITGGNENIKKVKEMIYSKAKLGDDKVFKY